jgi:hypothetical protein
LCVFAHWVRKRDVGAGEEEGGTEGSGGEGEKKGACEYVSIYDWVSVREICECVRVSVWSSVKSCVCVCVCACAYASEYVNVCVHVLVRVRVHAHVFWV